MTVCIFDYNYSGWGKDYTGKQFVPANIIQLRPDSKYHIILNKRPEENLKSLRSWMTFICAIRPWSKQGKIAKLMPTTREKRISA